MAHALLPSRKEDAMALSLPPLPPPPGRDRWSRSLLCRLLVSASASLLLLYNGPLRWRHASLARGIRYPVQDPDLLAMAEEDLGAWDDDGGGDRHHHRDEGARQKGRKPIVAFALPDSPEDLSAVGPEVSLVSFSTRRGIRFLNPSFDHLRLLWFGCSLHRILAYARRAGLDVDAVVALNVGDEWVEDPAFPVWSKGRRTDSAAAITTDEQEQQQQQKSNGTHAPPASPRGKRRDVMIPYEELLWNYPGPALAEASPYPRKMARAVFRGGCTHPFRREMVRTVRQALGGGEADVQVSCEAPFSGLTPREQSQYRCLLDYDGRSYSRRTAWYLETGSVVLRGGVIDDVLSRLGRGREERAREQRHGDGSWSEEPAPPIVFWRDDELVPTVRRCVADEEWGASHSQSSVRFWKQYVQRGRDVWEGYLLHLLVEQSKRFALVVPSNGAYESSRQGSSFPLFSALSSTMVCPLIADGAIPTGESGELHWNFVLLATALSLSVLCATHRWLAPLALRRLPRCLRRAAGAFCRHASRGTRAAPPPCARRAGSPARTLVAYLVQHDWMADDAAKKLGRDREE